MSTELLKANIPEEQNVIIDTSKSEVVYGLVDIEGKPIGVDIVSRIIKTPTIDTVVIMGEPGANKTTILQQLVREMIILTGGKIAVSTTLYDEILKEVATEVKIPRGEWPPSYWTDFSRKMHKSIRTKPENVKNIPGRRHIRIAEIVGLSITGGRDRAVSALNTLAAEMRLEPDSAPKTLLIAIAPDRRSQQRAGDIREAIMATPPEKVHQMLWNRFNIEVVGVPETTTGGKFIKEIVKEMAERPVIDKAMADVLLESINWSRNTDPEVFRNIWRKVRLPESADNLSNMYRGEYQLKASYINYRLHSQLGLSTTQAIVAFSPFRGDKIVHWPLVGMSSY